MPDIVPHTRSRQQVIEVLMPLAVPPKTAAKLLGFGLTHIYALLKSGDLKSFVDGGARRVLVVSINDFVARKLEASSKPVRRGPGRPKVASS